MDHPYDRVIASTKTEIPLEFNVEAGAYINAIRSSLDMLAWAIREREMLLLKPEEVYFPIANSAHDFATGNYKGSKFVRKLPRVYRDIIEASRPYKGGNKTLYALHYLDVVRKHRRLLKVAPRPVSLQSTQDFSPILDVGDGGVILWGDLSTGDNKTVLGWLTKGASQPKTKVVAYITLNEAEALTGQPFIGAVTNFASLADAIIRQFDF